MTKDRLKYLLDRYLTNTATEEELLEYADWYRQQAETGIPLFEEIDSETANEYKTGLFRSITNDIRFVEYEQKQQTGRRRSLYIKMAAAALVVISGTLVLYYGLTSNTIISVASNEIVAPVSAAPVIAVRNKTGTSTAVHLQDGSEVQLFAGSELRYEASFSPSHRHVYLIGKGFFKVAKDPNRPFTVFSHDIATTALGTSFTITAWPGKNDISVALHTGKVMVQHIVTGNAAHMKDVYLVPGQQVTCNITTGTATLHQPALAKSNVRSLGSRTGLAVTFTDEPMVNVLSAIEKGYAVQLQYDKTALADMIFTGRIREKDSLSQVLKRISILYDLNIKETGNQFIIQKSH
jgi:ferric-dicitrate binding protein FerR (iron transport regulator)